MTQELLHSSDVVAILQQVGRERMPKHVRAQRLGKLNPTRRPLDRLLNRRFVDVMTMLDSRPAVEVVGGSGEDPLPAPLAVRIRVLSGQGARQRDLPQPTLQIGFVPLPYEQQVVPQSIGRRGRQHGHPILLALTIPDDDFTAAKVEILDAQLEAFEQSQPGAYPA